MLINDDKKHLHDIKCWYNFDARFFNINEKWSIHFSLKDKVQSKCCYVSLWLLTETLPKGF